MSQDTPDLATMAASLSLLAPTTIPDALTANTNGNDPVPPETMTYPAETGALDAVALAATMSNDAGIAEADALDQLGGPEAAEFARVPDEATGAESGDPHTNEAKSVDDTVAAVHRDAEDEKVSPAPTIAIEMAGGTLTGVGDDIFKGFPAAPVQPGEFQLPLCDLLIGKTSDGGVYDFDAGAAETLCHAVKVPEAIAPVVVTRSGDAWHVTDGWARVKAFRAQFGNTANVMVRVIEWDGTCDDALYNRFAATFLTLKSRKIDKSVLLRQFHLAWNVPQLVLAARIGWTESRVTRELAAAEAMLEAPRFAELHVKAGDPPIDYLYKVQQARSDAAADDRAHPKRAPEKGAAAKLEAKLEALLAKSERFATAEALAKLGIGKPDKARATPAKSEPADVSAAASASQLIDCVEDSGGEAVAMIEVGADQLPSIRLLVDMTTLEDRRKAEVRHLVHEAVDRLLGF